MEMGTAHAMARNEKKMKSTFDFRHLEAAAKRMISLGHSLRDRCLALEKEMQKLERDAARRKTQLNKLGEFVVANFPEVSKNCHIHEENAVNAILGLLAELIEYRAY